MKALKEQLDKLQALFARLNQREQVVALGLGIGVATLVFLLVQLSFSAGIRSTKRRVQLKIDSLAAVTQLQGEYRAFQNEKQAQLRKLGRSQVRLVSLVEEAAKQSGVDIGQLRPEDGQPSAEGIIESRVDLRVTNLSIDRLQGFLGKLEQSADVIIRRLKIDKPYRTDKLDVEITVTVYKLKG